MGKKSDKEILAELLGIEPPPPTSNFYETEDDISRQAEAALAYARDSSYFIRRNCTICGRLFAHTYGQVAYCSNQCRAQALEKIGIKWEWVANAESRWGYNHADPLVVPPDALSILLSLPETVLPEPAQPSVKPPTPLGQDVFDILKGLGIE
jgi:hypothetical protein